MSVIPSHMKFSGLQVGGVSYNGISLDILKSAMQKYVRRNMEDKALWCAYEIDLFQMFGTVGVENGGLQGNKLTQLKALRTNLWNRLLIMSMEDVGIGNPCMPILVGALQNLYTTGTDDVRRQALYLMVLNLCRAEKSREISHLRCTYGQVPYAVGTSEPGNPDALTVAALYGEKYPDIYGFDHTLDALTGFTTYFNQRNDACIHFLLNVWHHKDNNTATRRYKAVLPMLNHAISHARVDGMDVREISLMKRVMDILLIWAKGYDFKESWMFPLQIVLLSLRGNGVPYSDDWAPIPTYSDGKVAGASNDEWFHMFDRNLDGEKIEIDDFCIDRHTKMGKRNGKDLKDFANEGSYVENESNATNSTYKEIYISFRQQYVQMEASGKSLSSATAFTSTSAMPPNATSTGTASQASSRSSTSASSRSSTSSDGATGTSGTQCEGITKAGIRCKKNGAHTVNGARYCAMHKPHTVSSIASTGSAPETHTGTVDAEPAQADVVPTIRFQVKHRINVEGLKAIYASPRGQLMTGRNKKQTFIPIEGKYKGYVVKGPWTSSSDTERLNVMTDRMDMLRKYGISFSPFIVAIGADDQGYTLSNNISKVDVSAYQYDEKMDPYVKIPHIVTQADGASASSAYVEPTVGAHVRVIKRSSMGITQMSNMSEEQQVNILFGDQFLFKGIVLLAIMRVGDVGPWNVIVPDATGIAVLIDLEENTSRGAFASIENFFAKKANKYTNILTKGIQRSHDKIRRMIEEYDVEFSGNTEWQNIKSVLNAQMI